jgi:hypothetical protein
MKIGRLNTGQRVVIVVALGISLHLVGQWLIGYWEFGSRDFGWVGYAPLSNTAFPGRILLHPWVILLIHLLLTTVWMVISMALLQQRPTKSAPSEESH